MCVIGDNSSRDDIAEIPDALLCSKHMHAVGVIVVEDYSESSSSGMAVFNSLREGEYIVTLQEEGHGITFVRAAETGIAAQLCIVQCGMHRLTESTQ